MTVVALDSNVLVGLFSPTDALHTASTEAVGRWESQGAGFVVSTVSWAEVLTGVLRQGRMDESEFRTLMEEVTDDVAPVDVTIASAAARLRRRDRTLRTPDALIVAAARQLSAAALLTGNRKLRRVDPDLVQVVSP